MEPINGIRIASPAPMPRVATPSASAPVPVKENDVVLPPIAGAGEIDLPDLSKKREAAVVRAATQIANTSILGSQTFTIFKDAAGQMVTRFFDQRSGRVTYIPEPELLRRAQVSDTSNVQLDA